MFILGIDQGLASVGYAIIKYEDSEIELIKYGAIKTKASTPTPKRFYQIKDEIEKLILEFGPKAIASESLFYTSPQKGKRNKSASIVSTNAVTGILMYLCGKHDINIELFVPSEIKKVICNNGKALKTDVIAKVLESYKIECKKSEKDHICDAISMAITFVEKRMDNRDEKTDET